MNDALNVDCPVCPAAQGEPCDEPLTHGERCDAVGDPAALAVVDFDGDCVASWEDLDDLAGWL